MLSVMYLEWDIEWESSMAVAIFTVLLIGFILGGSTAYLVENHLRTNEMNKIYKLTESLINGNELDGSDIGKETIYSKTTNQLIRLQEILEGRRKEAEKSKYEIQKLISEIAHQLRTPLANIKNYTELLQESLNETQETLNTEYIKDLRTSEEQLCFLVESFIKTARLEQGIINEVTHVKRFCLGKFDLCTDFSLINTGTIRFPFLSGNGREYNTFLFQTVDSFAFCCICKWNFVDSIGRRY